MPHNIRMHIIIAETQTNSVYRKQVLRCKKYLETTKKKLLQKFGDSTLFCLLIVFYMSNMPSFLHIKFNYEFIPAQICRIDVKLYACLIVIPEYLILTYD